MLGYGAINKKVHRFLQGFNIEFSILRRNWSKNEEEMPTPAKKYLPNDLLRFLEEIDILIIAVPETTKTIGMIRKEELKRRRNEIDLCFYFENIQDDFLAALNKEHIEYVLIEDGWN